MDGLHLEGGLFDGKCPLQQKFSRFSLSVVYYHTRLSWNSVSTANMPSWT